MIDNQFNKAMSAIQLLKEGVTDENKTKILAAYEIVEADEFSWDNLDVPFMEWKDMIDEANYILTRNN